MNLFGNVIDLFGNVINLFGNGGKPVWQCDKTCLAMGQPTLDSLRRSQRMESFLDTSSVFLLRAWAAEREGQGRGGGQRERGGQRGRGTERERDRGGEGGVVGKEKREVLECNDYFQTHSQCS